MEARIIWSKRKKCLMYSFFFSWVANIQRNLWKSELWVPINRSGPIKLSQTVADLVYGWPAIVTEQKQFTTFVGWHALMILGLTDLYNRGWGLWRRPWPWGLLFLFFTVVEVTYVVKVTILPGGLWLDLLELFGAFTVDMALALPYPSIFTVYAPNISLILQNSLLAQLTEVTPKTPLLIGAHTQR